MIDLETMGTSHHSLIIAIGATFFNPLSEELGHQFYMNIDWQSGMDAGMEMDTATVKWWLQQSPEAIQSILEHGEDIDHALDEFSKFLKQDEKLDGSIKVWGNGATFDISILENAYNFDTPWDFYNTRDCRTVEDLAKGIVDRKDIERKGIHHNALDDSIYQAKYISKMIQALTR